MSQQNFYSFGLWVFNCLDMTEMETCDVINVVEYISPDSYEELAEEIIINSLLNINDYQKNKITINYLIKYIILSFKENDMNLFIEKSKLVDYVMERKN